MERTDNMKRTTLYAAFAADGTPALGVWELNKRALEVRISERVANGDAFPGERPVRIYISAYNRILEKHNWPAVMTR